jgi:hypothetical protein
VTCLDDVWDGDLDERPADDEPADPRRHLYRRGRWRPIEDGPHLDDYQPATR